jgi:hypothetical protein
MKELNPVWNLETFFPGGVHQQADGRNESAYSRHSKISRCFNSINLFDN